MSERFGFKYNYSHCIDDKGRVALPGKIREELKKSDYPDDLVAFSDPEKGTLTLYPLEHWQRVESDLRAIEDTDARENALDYYQSRAEQLSLDKAGRLLIPQSHREVAGLGREVSVIGKLYKIEIRVRRPEDEANAEVLPKKPEASITKKLYL